VVEDTLFAKSEIKEFIDVDSIQKFKEKENILYRKSRDNKEIKRKLLCTKGKLAQERAAITTSRLVEWRAFDKAINFGTTMFIYDNKIGYITLAPEKDRYIGVIISDASIAKLHEAIFDFIWEDATPIGV
jgi:sugar-specific transcriptional regulator TrmB